MNLNCPHCSSSDVTCIDAHQIRCNSCGLTGPKKSSLLVARQSFLRSYCDNMRWYGMTSSFLNSLPDPLRIIDFNSLTDSEILDWASRLKEAGIRLPESWRP